MKRNTRKLGCVLVTASAAALLAFAAPVSATTIWTDWTSATVGAPGSAVGTAGGISVSYSGELDGAVINGTSSIWAPSSSFTGGTVTTGPASVGDDLRLNGSFTGVDTITFGSPVVDPLIAIWSLGQPALPASFIFSATPTVEAGGPNASFGGSSITVSGNTVNGTEGNGVVQFTGTFSSISWTNTFENFYAFTVGINGTPGPGPSVPEPGTTALLAIGLAAFSARRRVRAR